MSSFKRKFNDVISEEPEWFKKFKRDCYSKLEEGKIIGKKMDETEERYDSVGMETIYGMISNLNSVYIQDNTAGTDSFFQLNAITKTKAAAQSCIRQINGKRH